MTKIEEIALKAKEKQAQDKAAQELRQEREKEEKLEKILQEFEKGFSKQLPLLEEAGITYSAQFKPFNKGYCIHFEREHNSVKMDFVSATSYRYEFGESDSYNKFFYGEWDKEDFLVYLYDNLWKKKPF
jgi:hypothetical protein